MGGGVEKGAAEILSGRDQREARPAEKGQVQGIRGADPSRVCKGRLSGMFLSFSTLTPPTHTHALWMGQRRF